MKELGRLLMTLKIIGAIVTILVFVCALSLFIYLLVKGFEGGGSILQDMIRRGLGK